MTRPCQKILVRTIAALGLAGLVASMGCSTIGDPGGMPDGLPHGGTGQFRPLDDTETGIRSPLTGRAMVLSNATMGAATPVDLGTIFYATAPILDEPPEAPMDQPMNEVFWPAFGPQTIQRGAAYEGRSDDEQHFIGAYNRGSDVLKATEGWEGEDVFDPWPVVTEDGTVRLYYAAEGGIGVAQAASVDGSFTKVDGPIVGEVDGAIPRRPSVVPGIDGGWLMYFSADGAIGVARSDDGISFEVMERPTFEGPDETDSPEVARVHPGVARVVTVADRVLIRMYFESVRADGSHLIYLAASDDGSAFELHSRPVLDAVDARFPSPLLLDDRVTFLYVNRPFFPGSYQTRALVVTVAPAGERFDPPEEGEPCRNHPILGRFCGY